MNIRKQCMATATGLALTLAFAPAFAEGVNGPQVSTPQEKAQTEQLNQAQRNGSYVDPAVANGKATAEHPVPAEGVAAAVGNTANVDAQVQAQKDQQVATDQQYRQDLDRAAADREAYEHELAAYNWQRRHPSTWWRYRYENASLDAVYALDRPTLIDASVTDRSGFLVGHISDVVLAPSGRIARVLISIGHGRGAWIEARNLRYFRSDRMIMVNLSPSQIWDRSVIL